VRTKFLGHAAELTAMTPIKTKYVDRPELAETFADDVRMVGFKDNLLHMELVVTRLDEPHPPEPPTGRTYPAARLVLTPTAALKVHQNLSNLLAALEAQGMVHRTTLPPAVPPTPAKPN
jgi:hypothetical protein